MLVWKAVYSFKIIRKSIEDGRVAKWAFCDLQDIVVKSSPPLQKKQPHNIVLVGVINVLPHVGINQSLGSRCSLVVNVAVRSSLRRNSPCNVCLNIFGLLCKPSIGLAEEINDGEFCVLRKTLSKVVDSLFKLIDLVVNLPNQSHHLLK